MYDLIYDGFFYSVGVILAVLCLILGMFIVGMIFSIGATIIHKIELKQRGWSK